MPQLQKYLILNNCTAKQALKQLDIEGSGVIAPVLFVIDNEQKVVGAISDGDIRRGLMKDLNIEDSVEKFMNPNFRFFNENNFSKENILQQKNNNIRFVPLLDAQNRLLKILDLLNNRANIPATAIIMAGGKGERLLPLTATTPKPLIKIGEKPIIQYNIEQLVRYGIKEIYISVNYLASQIVDYLGDGSKFNVKIKYIYENEPLGTIGALSKIEGVDTDYILLMNSDLLTNIEFDILHETIVKTNAEMVIAAIPYNVQIPYAVIEVSEENIVQKFKEKPQYTYFSNAGIYFFKKKCIEYIPKNQKFDATDLMTVLMNNKLKIVTEPITNYWLDIGRIEDFAKAQEDIKHLKF